MTVASSLAKLTQYQTSEEYVSQERKVSPTRILAEQPINMPENQGILLVYKIPPSKDTPYAELVVKDKTTQFIFTLSLEIFDKNLDVNKYLSLFKTIAPTFQVRTKPS